MYNCIAYPGGLQNFKKKLEALLLQKGYHEDICVPRRCMCLYVSVHACVFQCISVYVCICKMEALNDDNLEYLGSCRVAVANQRTIIWFALIWFDPVLGSSGGAEEAGAGGGAERIVGEEGPNIPVRERRESRHCSGRWDDRGEWYKHVSTSRHIECCVNTLSASIYKN